MKNLKKINNYKISIVILNWNSWKNTLECLKYLFRIKYLNFQIVIVDNASHDNSIHKIRDFIKNIPMDMVEYHENELRMAGITSERAEKVKCGSNFNSIRDANFFEKIYLIENNENRGFAGGNNIGMDFSIQCLFPDYILLLNNDTKVDEDFLDELLDVAQNNDNLGSIQALLLDENGLNIDSLGQECYWWGAEDICMGHPFKEVIIRNMGDIEIFGSCAAAVMYPVGVLNKTGLFDTDFFVELEDVDLSWRIRLMGYQSYLARNSIVYHKRGVSGTITTVDLVKGLKNKSMIDKWYHQSKNWFLIVLRYYPPSVVVKAVFRYPHKVIFTFFRLIYSSLLMGRTRETFKILLDNLKTRKKLKKNPRWGETGQKWIKTGPKKCKINK
ncbi:MAG: glycosyltransferase family 2 protein [Methanobacterium sp.]|nr:glycosyltransferase family 2 protein [Methanobacterium sp.]